MRKTLAYVIKTLSLLSVFVCLLPLSAQQAPAPVNASTQVPERFKPAMDVAFKAGSSYFIWTTNAAVRGSVSPPIGSIVGFPVQVVAGPQPKAPRFRMHIDLLATNEDTKTITKYTSTFPGRAEDAYPYKDDIPYVAHFIAQDTKLKGSGVAKVYLIGGDGKPEDAPPISNIIEVTVEF